MPEYFHAALRGDQIHESKIKVLPAGSAFPVPEWEGQLLAVGLKLYFAVKQSDVLTWIQTTAYNNPVLPAGTVRFESGEENPPQPRNDKGIIYQNASLRKIWYLGNNSIWIELGTTTAPLTFEIIDNRAPENWQGNYFGYLNPTEGLSNCLRITKWQLGKKYYLAVKTPSIDSLPLAMDNNYFYLELWRDYSQVTLSSHLGGIESVAILDSTLFTSEYEGFRIGMYTLRNETKQYLNFIFDFESRVIQPDSLAQFSYGY